MLITGVILSTWLVNHAFAATDVAVHKGTGQAALTSAPEKIREFIRLASEAEIERMGSSSARAITFLSALDGSVEPARARAKKALDSYFKSSPLLETPRLLTAPEGGADGTCALNLEGSAFAAKYDLAQLHRNWQSILTKLFPPGKTAADYKSSDTKPFTSSKLDEAFAMAHAAGLQAELITVLQYMLVFDRSEALVRFMSRLEGNETLLRLGTHFLATWYFDPTGKYSIWFDGLKEALEAFKYLNVPELRERAELLVADLVDDFLSARVQREIKAAYKDDERAVMNYLPGVTSVLLDGLASVGRLTYIHTSHNYPGYTDTHVVGRLQTERGKEQARRLLDFARTLGMNTRSTHVIDLLHALEDTAKLRFDADDFKSRNENGMALNLYAAAGDLEGAKRAFLAGNWGQPGMYEHITGAIDCFADDGLAQHFIEFLRAEVSEWAAERGHAHWVKTRIPGLPQSSLESIETLFDRFNTSPVSRKGGRTSEEAMVEARRDFARESFGSAAYEGVQAAFHHADDRAGRPVRRRVNFSLRRRE